MRTTPSRREARKCPSTSTSDLDDAGRVEQIGGDVLAGG
jgi:hypothetical protein